MIPCRVLVARKVVDSVSGRMEMRNEEQVGFAHFQAQAYVLEERDVELDRLLIGTEDMRRQCITLDMKREEVLIGACGDARAKLLLGVNDVKYKM
jgi:hypothetical protein